MFILFCFLRACFKWKSRTKRQKRDIVEAIFFFFSFYPSDVALNLSCYGETLPCLCMGRGERLSEDDEEALSETS